MIKEKFERIYRNYKLLFYKELFQGLNQFNKDNLTAFDFFCLETIHLLKKPTMKEFANFLEVYSPNVSYKIKNLIQKGYLNKVMDEKDRRIFHLEVTDKFKKFYNKNDYSGMFVIDKIEKMFDSSELKRLEELLDLIVNKTKIEKE